ncbi:MULTISPECIES: Bug family tripartite tricarboxylate transporter substrate binding protein [Roseomonadaceae]|uniref:Tripartite tricarboxylate transporter substrate binding protein n=1 Tax=Falsiroseomonas oleicola TaxID=2801474 RepID=A0ABS6H815_9PROT|nr:tripartite tricarboxylate transporter substrate binding protein [Roseomonas oleicola]MBU8544846.1 tripartite tricarboxylate transporter substrate binding protein [Roseomonas oleicola]
MTAQDRNRDKGDLGRRGAFAAAVTLATAALLPRGGLAQSYPTRPLRMIVPFVPGGGADLTARFVAEPLGAELGQTVVVENRGGAGGTIGTAAVAQAPADGYTLLYGTPGPLVTNRFLMANLPYDPDRDFAPVSLLTQGAYLMVVNKDVPARSVAELIALAKARPGELTFASSGIGAGSHLSGELLCMQAGIRMSHVPYRGTGLALQDVAAGRVDISIDTYGPMIPLIEAGNLRPIAVTSARRSPDLPEVPTVAETLPGFEVTVMNYVCVRSGTPRPIIQRLNQALVKVLADPALRERMRAAGASPPVSSTPEELGGLLRNEVAKWGEVIRRVGITPR